MLGACAGGMLIIVVRVRVREDIAIDDIQLMPGVCAGGLGLGDIAIDDIQLMPGVCAGGCTNNPCVLGTCSGPVNSDPYTCTCNPGVTGTNCDQSTPFYQLICTFEFGEKCPFQNERSNVINWDTNSQGTPSSNTGPNNAHGGFQYVYTEMSGQDPGDKATMSTTLQLPTISRCMTFYYHMKGSTMGTLNIYSEGTNTAKYNIWTRSGAQGDDWIKAEIDIPAINGLKVSSLFNRHTSAINKPFWKLSLQ
ncbi:Hypothetical predicted protein [Mytilus galloprovincialis]|uniref:MAM domain-containing protein n=1 Tax=Mytilus galloprovincialis TaxID=29158 RepID=A0A8B6H448_MYTGA|nr:Hypothetical predicted protein [Mytilus galloprovincialis]